MNYDDAEKLSLLVLKINAAIDDSVAFVEDRTQRVPWMVTGGPLAGSWVRCWSTSRKNYGPSIRI